MPRPGRLLVLGVSACILAGLLGVSPASALPGLYVRHDAGSITVTATRS